jgi:hypothetical protein
MVRLLSWRGPFETLAEARKIARVMARKHTGGRVSVSRMKNSKPTKKGRKA